MYRSTNVRCRAVTSTTSAVGRSRSVAYALYPTIAPIRTTKPLMISSIVRFRTRAARQRIVNAP